MLDITGKKYGRLTVISFLGVKPGRGSQWLMRCECGREVKRYRHTLTQSVAKGFTPACAFCSNAAVGAKLRNVTPQNSRKVFDSLTRDEQIAALRYLGDRRTVEDACDAIEMVLADRANKVEMSAPLPPVYESRSYSWCYSDV